MMSEGQPYKCNVCGKIFPSGQYLDYLNHKRSHNE